MVWAKKRNVTNKIFSFTKHKSLEKSALPTGYIPISCRFSRGPLLARCVTFRVVARQRDDYTSILICLDPLTFEYFGLIHMDSTCFNSIMDVYDGACYCLGLGLARPL